MDRSRSTISIPQVQFKARYYRDGYRLPENFNSTGPIQGTVTS